MLFDENLWNDELKEIESTNFGTIDEYLDLIRCHKLKNPFLRGEIKKKEKKEKELILLYLNNLNST